LQKLPLLFMCHPEDPPIRRGREDPVTLPLLYGILRVAQNDGKTAFI